MEQEIDVKKQQSVEFSVNAKMQWSGKVKVYGLTSKEAFKEALDMAHLMEDVIRKKNEP